MFLIEDSQCDCAPFDSETSNLKILPRMNAARERRVDARRRTKNMTIVLCAVKTGRKTVPVISVVQDISAKGARFNLSERLLPGQEIELYLWGPNGSIPGRQKAKVVWSMPQSGEFQIGVWFHSPLSHDDLSALAS